MTEHKQEHPLKAYLKERNMSIRQAARAIGIAPKTVQNICSGNNKPNNITCVRIEKFTNGEIKAIDIMKEDHFERCPYCNRFTLQVKKDKS